MRTVGKALGCTINDVLMSTIAGALGGHLRDEGFDTRGLVVRVSVPVNLRAAEEPLTLGNKFGLVFVDMVLGIRNPLQRLYAMQQTMAALKGSLQPPMTLMVLGLMGLLPHVVQAPAIELFSRKASARWPGWVAATAIYAGVHIWSFNFMLVGAAAVAGAFWGVMYARLGSLAPVIVWHSVWSTVIFAVFPMQ